MASKLYDDYMGRGFSERWLKSAAISPLRVKAALYEKSHDPENVVSCPQCRGLFIRHEVVGIEERPPLGDCCSNGCYRETAGYVELARCVQEQYQQRQRAYQEYIRTAPEFYASDTWRRVRYLALKQSDGRCQACGRGRKHGVVLHVDHIKSRRKHPELALDLDNLQVLCEDCNMGKGGSDSTDWRGSPG